MHTWVVDYFQRLHNGAETANVSVVPTLLWLRNAEWQISNWFFSEHSASIVTSSIRVNISDTI
jgi:hypothetical protein